MTYIKTLTAPLIIIAGLALLTACGGTPAVNIGEVNINTGDPCTDDIFDSPDMCADEKNTFCTMPENIFTHAGCSNLDNINDIRTTFCEMPANIFAHAECENISNINALRTTFCALPDNLFNEMCISGGLGGNERDAFCKQSTNRFVQGCIDGGLNDNGRVVFCAIPGNRFNPMCIANGLDGAGRGNWCADPANRFNQMCITNNLGDDDRANFCNTETNWFNADCIKNDIGGDKRADFCAMLPTNRFDQRCIMNDLGDDERANFCGMPNNLFDPGCIMNNLGGDDRDTFCETLPTNRFNEGCIANDLGDNERDRFCKVLPTNRFDEGCIKNMLGDDERDTFCGMTGNLFNMGCTGNGLGSDDDRDTACLMHGINAGAGGHSTCPGRPEVIKTCKMNPFSSSGNPGCADISNINEIQDTYCAGTQADSIANGSAADECNVNYADWARGFRVLPTAASTTQNVLWGDITTATSGLTNLDLNTAKFDGRALGGDADSGLGFSTNTDGEEPTYQAGIFTTSNLGRPIETTAGVGAWNGSFNATNMAAAADFTLHINFATRQIAGIVSDGTTANYYYLIGAYTAGYTGGLITGTVQYGAFGTTAIDLTTATPTLPASSGTPTSGILSGIIGQEGAIGVFVSGSAVDTDGLITGGKGDTGYAGGFVVNPVAKIIPIVNYGDWARGFNVAPPPTPATPTRLNQFLDAGTNRLESALGGEDAPPALDFDNIYASNKQIDSDSNNGVAWFSVTDSPSIYYYAGIFETTDLGLPVTGKTATTAMWSGQFQTGEANAVAFDLEVTFGMVAGIPNSVGGIAAFIPSGNDHYLLSGTFDASGLIRGEVNFGEFMADTRTPTASRGANGFLTGIIGSNGAVGAFLSGTAISPDGVITAGTGDTGYAGGFVASPFAGKASYRTWVGSANPPATPASAPSGGNLNQFVQSIGNDVISAAHIGQSFNVNLGSLNGDPADGFNVYHITATDDYLVGLSSSTSVGTVLTSAPAAAWDGSFVVYENGVATTTAFKLNIDFSAEKLSATIGNYSFGTNVSFQSSGLFRGDINRTTPSSTGNLQGIIGAEGAVGVFHSDSNVTDSFAGGFVAAPPPPPSPLPNHANFKWYYTQSSTTASRRLHPDLTTGDLFAFVEGTPTSLPIDGLTFTNTGRFAPVVVRLGEAGSGDDGFALMYGDDGSNARYRAGLLSGTNLGAVLDNPPVTAWSGTIYTSLNVVGASPPASIPLTLTVNFNAGEINTTTPATHGDSDQHEIVVNGRFGSIHRLPDGILGGSVDYALSGNPPINGTLIGLIGADGVIGVFAGSNGATVIGGFQARPNP